MTHDYDEGTGTAEKTTTVEVILVAFFVIVMEVSDAWYWICDRVQTCTQWSPKKPW